MKYTDQDKKEIVNIIEQLKREFPGRSFKRIVKDAERVHLNRKTHKPKNSRPPEHVLRNIERVKRAEEERKKQGRSLPRARFVRGSAINNRSNCSRSAKSPDNSQEEHFDKSEVKQLPSNKIPGSIESHNYALPEKVDKAEIQLFQEGSLHQITVNAYERNSVARRKCIAYYGTQCYVCGFDFEKRYGEVGKGFIHVHHERTLGEIGEKYEVNPVEDLKPVCPNCHAIIHRKKPAYTITEVKELLRKHND